MEYLKQDLGFFYQELNHILDLLLQVTNPLTGYNVILKVLMGHFNAERCLIISNKKNKFKVIASSSSDLGKETYSRTILEKIKKKNEQLLIKKKEDLEFPGESLSRREITAMVIPLRSDHEDYGWLYLDRHFPSYTRFDIDTLNSFCEKLIKLLRWQDLYQEETDSSQLKWGLFAGQSSMMNKVYHQIQSVARTRTSCVIIEGETGTGKELAAQAIHQLSSRSKNPFLVLNCSQISQETAGDFLFGKDSLDIVQKGIIEEADGGTLFLDEITDLGIKEQARLLRVIEEQKMCRSDSHQEHEIDVRFIASTNLNLWSLVKKGEFRNDLYQRLNIVKITMPPLRTHRSDIIPIARQILKEINREQGFYIAGFSPELQSYLTRHNWKDGNVRELKNFLQRQAVFQQGKGSLQLNEEVDISADIPQAEAGQSLTDYLNEIKWARIKQVWLQNDKNKTKTAQKLGIPRRQLYRYLDEFEKRHGRELLKE